jgi:4-amino-4-deoxy-L-arabinose transferase-like glycosyltransferase
LSASFDWRAARRVAILGLLIAAISGTLAFDRLGANSIFGDEAIFANLARGVVANEQWYPLYYGTKLYVSKPPLSIWPMALRFEAAGPSELNTRIGSAAGGVLVSLLLFALGTCLLDSTAGAIAALLLITAPPWLLHHGVREGVGDIWSALFTGVALLAYVQGRIAGSRKLLAVAICAAVAGSLIKGPVVFLILFSVGLVWELGARALYGRRPRLLLLSGLVLASAIPFALWVVDSAARDPVARTKLWTQFIGRHTQALDPTHLHGAAFYPAVLAEAFGWWLLVLLLPPLWRWLRARELALLLPIWSIVPIATFTLSVSKLPWYADPSLPALAMLLGIAISAGMAQIRVPAVRYGIAALIVAALGLRVVAAWRAIHVPPRQTDMHRVALAYRAADRPALYVDRLDAPGFGYREWNSYYLNLLPRAAAGIPPAIDRSRCTLIVTMKPEPLVRRGDFAGAAIQRLRKYDPREADLYLLDLCGGRFVRALAAPPAS